ERPRVMCASRAQGRLALQRTSVSRRNPPRCPTPSACRSWLGALPRPRFKTPAPESKATLRPRLEVRVGGQDSRRDPLSEPGLTQAEEVGGLSQRGDARVFASAGRHTENPSS